MKMKIIFMGTPNFAVPILKAIYESEHKILEVYTQPATKSGRGQKFNHSDIFYCAEQLNLKVRSPNNLETNEEINHIKKLKPDLVVVVAYGKILPEKLLNIDKLLLPGHEALFVTSLCSFKENKGIFLNCCSNNSKLSKKLSIIIVLFIYNFSSYVYQPVTIYFSFVSLIIPL